MYIVQCTLYNAFSIENALYIYTFYSVHYTMYTPQYTVYSRYSDVNAGRVSQCKAVIIVACRL